MQKEEIEIHMVTITKDYKEGDIDLQWSSNIGFGHLAFYLGEDGKIYCNNETMSKDFIMKVFRKMVDDCVLNE